MRVSLFYIQMMRNGTLHIMSAVKTDGGNYTCAASDINNGLTSNPVIVEIKSKFVFQLWPLTNL